MLYILVILFGFIGNIFCNVICNGYSNYTLNNVNYTDTVGSKECIDDVCVYFNGVVTCDRTTDDSIVVKEDKFFGIFVGCYEDFEALININPFIKWPEIESDMKTCKSVPHGFHLRFVDRIGSYYGGFSLKCTTNGDYDKIVFGTSDTSLREDDLDEVMFNKSVLQNFTSG
uniref:Glycoprotein n=1 Tax=Parastrongyloides trichosuri TaxID=131310 RepID=A0A0N4ZJ17_PARTI